VVQSLYRHSLSLAEAKAGSFIVINLQLKLEAIDKKCSTSS
jgi:hypothetical protein